MKNTGKFTKRGGELLKGKYILPIIPKLSQWLSKK